MKHDDSLPESMVGMWNYRYSGDYQRQVYDDPTTAKVAGGFLNRPDIKTVEDWGCGYGGFKHFIGEHQRYIGIDGSNSKYADSIEDLEAYTSKAHAIHMRHVIEHNHNWAAVLSNAINSFRKRMVLTLFTPFQQETQIIKRHVNCFGPGIDAIDIGFQRAELITYFEGLSWHSIENIQTETDYKIEHLFLLERN